MGVYVRLSQISHSTQYNSRIPGIMKRKRSPEDSDDEKIKRSKHKKLKKDKKKKEKKDKKNKKRSEDREEPVIEETSRRMVPMTKAEWEKQQSEVRREFDEDTGRMRLVKGTGEILEECVSRERQQAINKQATLADGASFQRSLKNQLK